MAVRAHLAVATPRRIEFDKSRLAIDRRFKAFDATIEYARESNCYVDVRQAEEGRQQSDSAHCFVRSCCETTSKFGAGVINNTTLQLSLCCGAPKHAPRGLDCT